MIAVFGSIGRAGLCRDRAIPTVPESCKNHPVKSRPYSHSGKGILVKRPAGRWQGRPDRVPYRGFHVGEGCSPFVSDMRRPGFSDGGMIHGGVCS